MTPEEQAILDYTFAHFTEIARLNRFPENDRIEHDRSRCAVCHPDLVTMHPFRLAVEVVAESIKVRRPRLDRELIDVLNEDRQLAGKPADLTAERLLSGDPEAVEAWRDWAREALDTGLSLLSIHADDAPDYTVDDAEELGLEELVERKAEEIVKNQERNAG